MEAWVKLWDYAVVTALSGFKFVPGVLAALALKMNFWETTFCTGVGGVTGSVFFSYFGNQISLAVAKLRARFGRRRSGTPVPKPETTVQRVWRKYGLTGVAALTPPFFSPPIGTAIALGFGVPPRRIVAHMAVSFAVWAPVSGTLTLFDYRAAWNAVFG